MGTFNNQPSNTKRVSGQGGSLNIAGVGAFGVTSCRIKRSYTNADVTVTSSLSWEEHTPIVRGLTLEVEVPFDANQVRIDPLFDGMFNANPGQPITCSFTLSNNAASYSGSGIMESYEMDDTAKDAVRLTFTIRVTGVVTVT